MTLPAQRRHLEAPSTSGPAQQITDCALDRKLGRLIIDHPVAPRVQLLVSVPFTVDHQYLLCSNALAHPYRPRSHFLFESAGSMAESQRGDRQAGAECEADDLDGETEDRIAQAA
jgi:hypothetical protein